ncbi:MAG: RNA polymerase sigma factor [Actinomycetota bacterium]|nr:RNA polymerase sigma factor [Actinomycetota bacterium]
MMTVSDIEQLLSRIEPRLRQALVAAYGVETGQDCSADAMAWAWEHRERLIAMGNPAGYLYRVGQSSARVYHRPQGFLPRPDPGWMPDIEPGLAPALEQLTVPQRVAVLAVHSFGWSQQEVADLLGVSHSTIRTHLARGLEKLLANLEVANAH